MTKMKFFMVAFATYANHVISNEVKKVQFQLLPTLIQMQPPEMFYKKGVLKNFAKFTGKHLCQSLLFNEVAHTC